MKSLDLIKNSIKENISTHKKILKMAPEIQAIASVVLSCYKHNRKVLIFGNGGSAADAQHITAELVNKFLMNRRPLPALALTTNTSNITAIANDFGFEKIFSRQIKALSNKGDVAIGISTSGNSENVMLGMETAKEIGLTTIGLTGKEGNKLQKIVDYCICVPSEKTPKIQEAHIMIGHIICELVEKSLFYEKENQ